MPTCPFLTWDGPETRPADLEPRQLVTAPVRFASAHGTRAAAYLTVVNALG
jgi:hypothetical protein